MFQIGPPRFLLGDITSWCCTSTDISLLLMRLMLLRSRKCFLGHLCATLSSAMNGGRTSRRGRPLPVPCPPPAATPCEGGVGAGGAGTSARAPQGHASGGACRRGDGVARGEGGGVRGQMSQGEPGSAPAATPRAGGYAPGAEGGGHHGGSPPPRHQGGG